VTSRPDDELELNAYVDGELDAMAALAFERKLAATPELARRHRSMLNLSAALRATVADDVPAQGLAARVNRAVGVGRRTHTATLHATNWRAGNWRALAASLVIGAAIAGLGTWQIADRGNAPSASDYLVASHMRSLLAAQPIDVATSDRHTVKPWFAGKVAQSPDVYDLSADGFTLVGGRVDVVGRQPVATTVYRRAQHLISLTVLDDTQGAPTNVSVAGFHSRTWSDGGLIYVAISDLPEADLANFERSFRASMSAAK
jgi:anti-sigma factor RsiW